MCVVPIIPVYITEKLEHDCAFFNSEGGNPEFLVCDKTTERDIDRRQVWLSEPHGHPPCKFTLRKSPVLIGIRHRDFCLHAAHLQSIYVQCHGRAGLDNISSIGRHRREDELVVELFEKDIFRIAGLRMDATRCSGEDEEGGKEYKLS